MKKPNQEFFEYKRSLTAEQVLDDELILNHLGTIDSFESPYDAYQALITYHVDMTLDCIQNDPFVS